MTLLRQVLGQFRAWLLWRDRRYQGLYIQMRNRRLGHVFSHPAERQFVMTVGFSGSGKSVLVATHPQLSRYFQVDTDSIHDELNAGIPELQDDRTTRGPAYWTRQTLARKFRIDLLRRLFHDGINVVNQSCNLVRLQRAELLEMAKQNRYRTTIVVVECPLDELRARLRTQDNLKRQRGETPTWVDLFERVQRPRFEPVQAIEADRILRYRNPGQDPARLQL